MSNHAHGEVSGFSRFDYRGLYYNPETYVYKNGEEHFFDGIYIKNPVFTQGEKEDIVYAISGDGTQKYVLDLFQNKAIEIEHSMDDNKNEPQINPSSPANHTESRIVAQKP